MKEGELEKMSRKGVNTRYFVLLSDCLLYCNNTNNTLTGQSRIGENHFLNDYDFTLGVDLTFQLTRLGLHASYQSQVETLSSALFGML